MEEVKNFEKLVEDLKQDLTSIVATPKTREILDTPSEHQDHQ